MSIRALLLALLPAALVALVAAAPAARAQAQSPYGGTPPEGPLAALKAGEAEYYLHPVPEGWTWQLVDSESPYHAITFLPEGQPRRGWTDGLVLGLRRDGALSPQALLTWAERRLATECRDLRRSGLEQGRSAEGWDEAWRLLACRSRRDDGRGEVQLLRAVQGEGAGYLIRRVWRTPAFDAAFPVGQSEVEVARGLLASGDPCLQDSAARACPPFTAMGLGSIEAAKPYGVFEIR